MNQSILLGKNKLTRLPEAVYKFSYVTRLDLSNNHLVLVEDLNILPLEILDLSNNMLEEFPESIRKLNLGLTTLNLSNNQLRRVPDWISELSFLHSLDLSDNPMDPWLTVCFSCQRDQVREFQKLVVGGRSAFLGNSFSSASESKSPSMVAVPRTSGATPLLQNAPPSTTSAKEPVAVAAQSAAPAKGPAAAAAAAVPSNPGTLTTEQQLVSAIRSVTSADESQRLIGLVMEKDWGALVETLSVVAGKVNLPVVSAFLTNVLGPLGDAQSFVKAAIGIVNTVVQMAQTVRAVNEECQLLARQMNDMMPSLKMLVAALRQKVEASLKSATSVSEMEQFKRETESLSGPLQTINAVAKAVEQAITEWTALGASLFGKFKRLLTGSAVQQQFVALAARIATASQTLQGALAIMTFINVNSVQEELRGARIDPAAMQKAMEQAIKKDREELPKQLKTAMAVDPEFKRELEAHWNEISTELKSQFGELHSFLEGEFGKVHRKLDDIQKGMERAQTNPHLGALSVKFEDLEFNQDSAGEDFLGEGSFGMVYKCRWGPNKYAVKLLPLAKGISKNQRQEIIQEALKMANVTHRNTVRLRGVCLDKPPFCLIMDLVGPDLHAFLGDAKLQPPQQLCLARQLACGMEAVHDEGIVHGDVRSPNVLVGPAKSRECRVADFGLATTRSEATTATTSTVRNTNSVWRSPELLMTPGAKLTKENDVWSYGCVLYEIATGSVPWKGTSLDEVKSFYGERKLLNLDGADPNMRRLIQSCWQFAPKDRPTFRELIKMIDAMGNAVAREVGC